nr:recombinase family protein [Kibdelosporangium sp. MJ126-NF4]
MVKVLIENDVSKNGKHRNASAFKRKTITLPDGTTAQRVVRPKFREILDDFVAGRASGLLAEDLDRTMRDPRDLEDLIDVAQTHRINARSIAGSLTLTDGGTDAEITMARVMVTMANKSSRDTARRVAAARERKALNGEFGGGQRPFGFERDGVTPVWHETEVIAIANQRVIHGAPLKLLARELRDGEVPTVTGAPWSAETLREILLRPRNAGLMVLRGEVIGRAPWPRIVPETVHAEVVRILTDPSRTFGPGAAPKWLGSGIYRCGVCDDIQTCEVTSGGRAPRYRCKGGNHLTRNAGHVDDYVQAALIARLSESDAVGLFAPPTPEVDVAGLRTERDAITSNLNELAADKAMGLIDREQLITGTRRGKARQAEIDEILRPVLAGSPVADLVKSADVQAEWYARPLSFQRAVLDMVMTVTIMPTGKAGRGFDPTAVKIEWKPGTVPVGK